MEFAIWLMVGLVIGGGIGALATWWISRARGGAVSVMQLKQENEKFRNEVTEHFVETARLINQMTDSYKQVFDHLSSGAEKLVDDKKLAERLPPSSGQEVRLSDFGASGSAGSRSASSSQASQQAGDRAGDPAGDRSGAGGDSGRERGSESGASGRSGNGDPLKNRSGQSGPGSSRSGQKGEQQSGSTSQAGDRTSSSGGTTGKKESTAAQASDNSR